MLIPWRVYIYIYIYIRCTVFIHQTWPSWFPPGYQEAFQGTAPNHRAEDGRTVVTGWWMRDQMETDHLFSWETNRF